MLPHEDFELLEQQVREMVRKHHLPEPVSGFEVDFDDTWYGDPAVRIKLHVPPDTISSDEAQEYARLLAELAQGLRATIPGRSASISMIAAPNVLR